MKHFHALAIALLVLLCLAGCKKQTTSTEQGGMSDSAADTIVTEQMADSTIYGTSDEFGMSTFTLISDKGDTLNVTRTAEDGTDGKIIGDLAEGQRYAMTTRDNNEAIGVLINLTQLNKHLKNYEIVNGKVVVNGDTLQIEELSDRTFKTK